MKHLYAAALIFALILAQSTSALAWWSIGSMPITQTQTPIARKIIKVHTEYSDGNIWFIAYFVSTTEVIALSEIDRPDVAAMRKLLDDAFAQGKSLTYFENRARDKRVARWYDANERSADITWYDVKAGDWLTARFK